MGLTGGQQMREEEGDRIQNVLHKCMKLSKNKFNNKKGGAGEVAV